MAIIDISMMGVYSNIMRMRVMKTQGFSKYMKGNTNYWKNKLNLIPNIEHENK
jgi:hypothetical protein